MSDDLKPCPFCGGEASLRDDSHHSTAFYFGCSTAGCNGHDLWEETEVEAITAWNTRADTDALTAAQEENERLVHDIERLSASLSAEVTENERLREELEDVRMYGLPK